MTRATGIFLHRMSCCQRGGSFAAPVYRVGVLPSMAFDRPEHTMPPIATRPLSGQPGNDLTVLGN